MLHELCAFFTSADELRVFFVDPVEPRDSFSSDMLICCLISSCLIFRHNYETKAAMNQRLLSAFWFWHSWLILWGEERGVLSDHWWNVMEYIYSIWRYLNISTDLTFSSVTSVTINGTIYWQKWNIVSISSVNKNKNPVFVKSTEDTETKQTLFHGHCSVRRGGCTKPYTLLL